MALVDHEVADAIVIIGRNHARALNRLPAVGHGPRRSHRLLRNDRQLPDQCVHLRQDPHHHRGKPPRRRASTSRDRGRGVPQKFVPRLFERFSREPVTQRTIEGTCLGLWIVHNLAHANNGDDWYEPDPRTGARFYVRLPTVPPPAQG